MKWVRGLCLAGFAVLMGLATGGDAAQAQSGETRDVSPGRYERYGGVADRFNVRVGVLFASHSTLARLDSEELGVGTLLNAEDLLGLDGDTRNLRADAYVRLGRRHQLRAGYVSLDRSASVDLTQAIQWGDEVFDVAATVATAVELLLVPVNYRFSVVKSDRVDLGLSAGVFAMFSEASITAPEAGIAEAESADFPLPVLGADVDIALAPRLFLVGGLEYFALSIEEVDGSWAEFRGALEYFPLPNVAFGAGYRAVTLEVDSTGALDGGSVGTRILFDYEFQGPLVYLTLSL